MMPIPDHPVIQNMERTGYPRVIEPKHTCDWCGANIHTWDDFWNIHGEILCAKCVEDCRVEGET